MLDPLLRNFVEATDTADAERALDRLVQLHALPLARAIVARKLRSYRSEAAGHSNADDRNDVVGDAMVTLIERLHAARNGGERAPIENFVSYTAAVVHSACAHHIRRRYPARTRLKNRLRYVFSTDRRLALWTSDDELVCGRAEWSGAPADATAEGTLRRRLEATHQEWPAMTRPQLTTAVLEAVRVAGAPVGFDAVVAAAAAGIVEPHESGDPSGFATEEPLHDVLIDQRRFLARVWNEVVDLPIRQRIALLLNLRDVTGTGLLWLLPVIGVATIRQIAHVLEIQDVEFARLWRDIPLDDATIGRRLGCTRQQVINLRMAARKRLMNRIGPRGATADRARRRANLAAFSISPEGTS